MSPWIMMDAVQALHHHIFFWFLQKQKLAHRYIPKVHPMQRLMLHIQRHKAGLAQH
jgi:hypothetical protein